MKIFVMVLITAVVIAGVFIYTADGQKVTVEQWRKDLGYLAGQIAYRHPNPWYYGPSEEEFAGEAEEIKNAKALIRRYQEFRSIPRNKWLDVEADLDAYGNEFLKSGRTGEAIEVFEFVTALYPWSWKAFDNLARAYEEKGLDARARGYSEKSFSLNRMNFYALERLE